MMGIIGIIHYWIISFLTRRCQVVHVKGAKFEKEPVLSVVPHKSVTGGRILVTTIVRTILRIMKIYEFF